MSKKTVDEDPNLVALPRSHQDYRDLRDIVLGFSEGNLPTASKFYWENDFYKTIYKWKSFQGQYYYLLKKRKESLQLGESKY